MNAVTHRENPGNPPSAHPVAEWLAALARLVSPSFPDDAAVRFSAYAPLLSALPLAAFNPDTLDDAARCATARNGFPTYAEIHAVLAAWIAERRPRERRETTPIASLPPSERCTPEQAAASLAAHGWRRTDTRLVPPFATVAERAPVTPRYLTGEALAEARRRARIRTASVGAVP